jgi:sulfur relay (sulfurtransferase) DsrC/TusE family protein
MNRYTKQELIEAIVRFHEENGRVPKSYEFDNNLLYPSQTIYVSHFGSWDNALKTCGFDVNQKKMKYSDDELIGFIVDFYGKHNQIPTTKDFSNSSSYPDSNTYRKRFGSWPNAIKLAGFAPKRNTPSKYKSDEDRINGYKKTNLKSIHKRKRSMGFNPLNEYFENSHAHHLHIKNHNDVLYIPRELHMAIGHNHHMNKNIFEINLHSLNWYLHNYNDSEEFKNVMHAFNLDFDSIDINNIIKSFEPENNDELRKELVSLNGEISKYTDDQLVHYIQSYYNTHEEIPEFSDFQRREINPLIYIYRYKSWVNALRLMGFDVTELLDKNKIYARAELIQYLKLLAEELGRAPKIYDMDNKRGYPTSAPYRSMFGSWNNALIECGFDVNYQTYTKPELLSYMKSFYEDNGRPPMIKDFDNNPSHPSRHAYTIAFGSWNTALLKCGFKIIHSSFTSEELIGYIHKYYEEYGAVPKYDDFCDNPDYPSPNSYERQFGSWNNSIKEAGYEPYVHAQKYTNEELINYIRDFYSKYNRIPSYSNFSKNPEYPSARTYSDRFGSWKNAILKCEFEDYHPTITKDDLIRYIHRYYDEYGKVPKYDDFRDNPDYPSPSSYERQFGSWSNGIKTAGYAPYKQMHINTDDELLEYIHKFNIKNQRLPTSRDFSKNPEYPSARTYSERFGSWKRALEIYQN